MQIIEQISSKYTESLRGEDKVIYNGHKETEDDGCEETRRRYDGVQQGDGCEEKEGRNRETVDTGETNPSTGSNLFFRFTMCTLNALGLRGRRGVILGSLARAGSQMPLEPLLARY